MTALPVVPPLPVCGHTHPDRPGVRCVLRPYHRSTEIGPATHLGRTPGGDVVAWDHPAPRLKAVPA